MKVAMQVRELAERYGIADVYVFGSRAPEVAARVRGDLAATALGAGCADVDIGVRPHRRGWRLDAAERVDIAVALEDLFDASCVDRVSARKGGIASPGVRRG